MIGVHPAVDKEDIVREKDLAKRSPFTLKRDLLKEHQGDIEQAKDDSTSRGYYSTSSLRHITLIWWSFGIKTLAQ